MLKTALKAIIQSRMKSIQKSSFKDPGFFIPKMKMYFKIMIALNSIKMLDANIILAKPNIGQRLLGRGGKKKMMASVVTAVTVPKILFQQMRATSLLVRIHLESAP